MDNSFVKLINSATGEMNRIDFLLSIKLSKVRSEKEELRKIQKFFYSVYEDEEITVDELREEVKWFLDKLSEQKEEY